MIGEPGEDVGIQVLTMLVVVWRRSRGSLMLELKLVWLGVLRVDGGRHSIFEQHPDLLVVIK